MVQFPYYWGFVGDSFPVAFSTPPNSKLLKRGVPYWGGLAMAAFGLGTAPMMVGVGLSVSRLSANRRSQLFRLGGWVTLSIGLLTLLRTDAMVDLTGHSALLLLMLALAARPLRPIWPSPLRYRRLIGVGAYVLVLAHLSHMLDHSLDWNPRAIAFLMPRQRWALWAGISAFLLMTPAALSSSDRAQRLLGKYWRPLHGLTRPALVLATLHGLTLGSHYLGTLSPNWGNWLRSLLLLILTLTVFLLRGGIGKKALSQQSLSSRDPNA